MSVPTTGPEGSGLETMFLGGRATARRLRRSRWVVVDGPDRGRVHEMTAARMVIGRSAVCDLHLNDRAVSNTHAEVEAIEGGWVLRDLGSTNGCFLGDVRLREVVLPLGARVRVGQTTLQVEPAAGVVEIALSTDDRFHDLVGRSIAMRQVFAQLERMAQLDLTVLVTGETGTGKELVARALHRASKRAAGPLVVQDCSAIPRDLVESVLFGHERGAFTGAHERRPGSFEQADKGTLFLDEVGELESSLQPKLLRVLEHREVRRVGGDRTVHVDVRVVAATNRDLRAMAANGTFREDLYYRLGVVPIELPPLRARREDIPLLAASLLEGFCARNPEVGPRRFTDGALARLRAAVARQRARAAQRGRARGLPRRRRGHHRRRPAPVEPRPSRRRARAAARVQAAPTPRAAVSPEAADAPAPASPAVPSAPAVGAMGALDATLATLPFKDAKARVLEVFEPAYLAALLERHGGNITRSAAAAGLTRYHLRELCKRYNLRDTDNEPE
jgi:DNA-binding NtrC family response regulator